MTAAQNAPTIRQISPPKSRPSPASPGNRLRYRAALAARPELEAQLSPLVGLGSGIAGITVDEVMGGRLGLRHLPWGKIRAVVDGIRTPPKKLRGWRRQEDTRRRLPYGVWTCADGREVLFNRYYKPIWQRLAGQPATAADPAEWVPFVQQGCFYKDGNTPFRNRTTHRRCQAILAAWGIVDQPLS